MRRRSGNLALAAALAAALALGAYGCGGGDAGANGAQDADTDAADVGLDTGVLDSGGGDAGGSDADAAPAIPGHAGTALAAGGAVSKSANFKLIGTLGQGPGGNGVAKSGSYQLRGGVVGATQRP